MVYQRKTIILFLVLFLFGLKLQPATSSSRPQASALEAIQLVNLGVPAGNATTPRRLALNSQTGRLYFLSEGVPVLKEGNGLTMYDLETGEIESHTTINEGDNEALDLEIDPEAGLLYGLWRDRTTGQPPVLSVIDEQSLRPVQELPGLETIAAGGGQLYGSNGGQLLAFEASNGGITERQRLNLPQATPGPMAVSPAANRLYLARSANGSWSMEIFEADTLTFLSSYQAEGPILNILPLPDRDELFLVVAANDFRLLYRLDSTGELLDLPYELGPRLGIEGVALSQDGQTLYYSNGQLRSLETTPGETTEPALLGLAIEGLAQTHQIPLLTNFEDLVIDEKTEQAFALYPYNNFLYVIDLEGETTRIVTTAIEIRDVLVDEVAGEIFVSDTSNRIRRLEAGSFDLLAENRLAGNLPDYGFQFAPWSGELWLDREQNRLYVSGLPGLALEADTLAEVAVLEPGGQLVPDPTQELLYASNCGVTVLAPQSFEEIMTLPESQRRKDDLVPNPCVDYSRLDPQNQLLYSLVPNGVPGSNSGTYLYVYELGLEPSLVFSDTNISLLEVEPDPAGQRAFVSFVRHSDRRILNLDVSRPEVMGYTNQLLGLSGAMAYDSETAQLYVSDTDHNRLLVLESGSLSVVDELALPPNYGFRLAALDPASGQLYLAGLKGQLLVISAAEGEEPLSEEIAELVSTPISRLPDGRVLALEQSGEKIFARIEASYSQYSTESRLYASEDEGQSWEDLSQNLPLLPVQAFVVAPETEAVPVLFAALLAPGQSGGLYKSVDGGQSWLPAMTGLTDLWVNELFISPNFDQDSLIFAATAYAGLHQSVDGGGSWAPLADLDPQAIFPTSSSDYGVAFSDDGIVLVSQALEGMRGIFRATLEVDGILSSWRQVLDIPVSTLALSPDGATALAFGTGLWYSLDGGQSWQVGGAGLTGVENLQPDRILFSSNYAEDQIVYFFFKDFSGSAPGRLFRSTDGGQSWQLWITPATGQIYTTVTLTPEGSLLLGTQQAEVTEVDPSTLTWAADLAGVAAQVPFDDLAVSSGFTDDQTMFALSKQAGLFQSADGGQHWELTPFPARSFGFTSERYRLALSPNFEQDETLFVATGRSLHRSTDGGASWAQLSLEEENSGASFQVQKIALSPNFGEDETLLVGTPVAVYRSTDGGESWQKVLEARGESTIIDILNLGPEGQLAYAHFAYSPELFMSRDGGQSWQPEAGNPDDLFTIVSSDTGPNNVLTAVLEYDTRVLQAGPQIPPWQAVNQPPATALSSPLAVLYGAGGDLFLGGQGGAFRSMDNGQSWQPLPAEGLPADVPVKALRLAEAQLFALMNDGQIFTLPSEANRWLNISVVK